MNIFWSLWNFIDDLANFTSRFTHFLNWISEANSALGTVIYLVILLIAPFAATALLVTFSFRFVSKLKYGGIKKDFGLKMIAASLFAGIILASFALLLWISFWSNNQEFRQWMSAGISPLIFMNVAGYVSSIGIGIASVPFLLVEALQLLTKKRWSNILLATQIFGIIFGLSFTVSLFEEFSTPTPPRYANILHAAIKNTCLYDYRHENCPHTLEEIGRVEPKNFADAQAETQMRYEYNPDTNAYVFVMRFSKREGIIFDQRFAERGGIDVARVQFDTWGVDHINNPPPFAGPWDNWPDWDKGI